MRSAWLWGLALAALVAVAAAAATSAQGSAGPPHQFDGSVRIRINGQPVAAGTSVLAFVDGHVCGGATVVAGGMYRLHVPTACAEDGDTVHFSVGGHPAAETGTYAAGTRTALSLTVNTGMGDEPDDPGEPADPGFDDGPAEPDFDDEPADPDEPNMGDGDGHMPAVEVTLWRSVADPSILYLSTRPAGGSWRTHDTPLDMSRLSRSGRFHQSNTITVTVPLAGGGRVNVEAMVWRSVADPSVLYLSTRPEGGSWRTEQEPLDMSRLSRSGRFHQSNPITVEVPAPERPTPTPTPRPTRTPTPTPTPRDSAQTCSMQRTAARVIASTVRVETSTNRLGTAFYVGSGLFITAAHVVHDNPDTVRLRNAYYDSYASIMGYTDDEDGDVAILSAPASSLTALRWAGTLNVGETIAVVGYPEGLGLTASITRGIVSRLFTAEGVSYIQTDSAVSPGNSGGPLVDDCGRVAGVMSGSYVGERGSEGLHFAVGEPTLTARLVALRTGEYVRPVQERRLTITAFCMKFPSEDIQSAECDRRSSSLILGGGRTWSVWARGVSDWDDVLYRFNGGNSRYKSGVQSALRTLGVGCHELQVAEEGVSTQWSVPYEFCIVQQIVRPTPAPTPWPTPPPTSTPRYSMGNVWTIVINYACPGTSRTWRTALERRTAYFSNGVWSVELIWNDPRSGNPTIKALFDEITGIISVTKAHCG